MDLSKLSQSQLQDIVSNQGVFEKFRPDTAQALMGLQEEPVEQPPVEPQVPEQGPFAAGIDRMQADFQTALGAAANRLGLADTEKSLMESAEANRLAASGFQPTVTSYKDVGSVGEAASYLYEGAAQSAPYLLGTLGAGGAAVAAAPAAIPAAVAGAAGGALFTFPFFVGGNVERQMQENGVSLEDVRLGDAAAAASGQAALESLINVAAPGVGKVMSRAAGSTTKAIPIFAKNAVTSGAIEGFTEAGQQALEIVQADPEKLFELSPEVADELINSAILGAALGGAVGGTLGGSQDFFKARNRAREEKEFTKRGQREALSLGKTIEEIQTQDRTATLDNVPTDELVLSLSDESLDRADPLDPDQRAPQESVKIVADRGQFSYGERGEDAGTRKEVRRPSKGFIVVGEETGNQYRAGFKTEKEANDWVENTQELDRRVKSSKAAGQLETRGEFDEAKAVIESSDISPDFRQALLRRNERKRSLYSSTIEPLNKKIEAIEEKDSKTEKDKERLRELRTIRRTSQKNINKSVAIKGRDFSFEEPTNFNEETIKKQLLHPDTAGKVFHAKEIYKKGAEPTFRIIDLKTGKKRGKPMSREQAEVLVNDLRKKKPDREFEIEQASEGEFGFAVVEESFDAFGNKLSETVDQTFPTMEEAIRYRRTLQDEIGPDIDLAPAKSIDESREIVGKVNKLLADFNLDDKVKVKFQSFIQDRRANIVARGETYTDPNLGVMMRLATEMPAAVGDKEAIDTIISTAKHEALHAMKMMNLISTKEWGQLVEAARRMPMQGYKDLSFMDGAELQYKDTYRGRDNYQTLIDEEAVAALFEEYGRRPERFKARPAQRNVFRKILDFFRKLLPISQDQRAGEVFGLIESGQVGARSPAIAGAGTRFSGVRFDPNTGDALDEEGNVLSQAEYDAIIDDYYNTANTEQDYADAAIGQAIAQDSIEDLEADRPDTFGDEKSRERKGFLIDGVFIEPVITRTKPPQENWIEFIKWFDGSYVITPDGDPLVMFHGTKGQEFDQFEVSPDRKIDYGWYGEGHYFTPSPTTASSYATPYDSPEVGGAFAEQNRIIPTMLSIKNPFIVSNLDAANLMSLVRRRHPEKSDRAVELVQNTAPDPKFEYDDFNQKRNISVKAATKLLKELGYDGVIAQTMDRQADEIVAFYPHQIKSIFNQFDPGTAADARFSGYAIRTGTDIKEFTEWFEGSQVVDGNGLPLDIGGEYLSIKNPFLAAAGQETTKEEIGGAGFDGVAYPDGKWIALDPEKQSKRIFSQAPLNRLSGYRLPDYDAGPIAEVAARALAPEGELGFRGSINRLMRGLIGADDLDPQMDLTTKEGRQALSNVMVRNIAHKQMGAFKEDRALQAALGNSGIPMAKDSAGKMLELATQMAGRIQAIIEKGGLKYDEEGNITIDEDAPSLAEVFEEINPQTAHEFNGRQITEDQLFQIYGIARREKSHRENNAGAKLFKISNEKINEVLAAAPQKFERAFEKYQKLNSNIIDFAVESEVISREKADELLNFDYIPFYRKLEVDVENQAYIGATWSNKFLQSLNNPNPFSIELLGGDQPLDNDPIDMIRKNIEGIVRASLSNRALKQVATTLDALNDQAGTRDLYGSKVRRSADEKGGSIMTFRRGNEEIKYKIKDNDLWVAITSMNKTQVSSFINLLSKPAAILRQGITHSPAFMLANLWRGHIDAYVKHKIPPVRSFIKTLGYLSDVYRGTDEVMAFKANTGMGGFDVGNVNRGALSDLSAFSKKMKRGMRKEARRRGEYAGGASRAFFDGLSGMWDGLTKIGEATELAQRLAVSTYLQEAGTPKLEADYQGMNIINYSRRGSGGTGIPMVLMNLIPMIPFLNARIQGLYRLMENEKSGNTLGVAHGLMTKGLLLAGIHSAIYGISQLDDRWDEERLDRKLNYDIFYVGDKTFYLPRSFEIGAAFGAMPVLALDAMRTGETDDLGKGTISILANTFQLNPIPQAAKPIIEALTNFDMFLGRPIENQAARRLAPGLRSTPSTTDVAKMVGEATGTSPLMLEHLAQGYGGSMSMMLLAFADSVIQMTGTVPSKPAGLFGDASVIGGQAWMGQIAGLSRFVRADDERGTRFAEDFYEMKEEITELHMTIKELTTRGRVQEAQKLIEENRGKLMLRKRIDRTSRQLSQINKQINKVRADPNMNATQKRSLLSKYKKQKMDLMRVITNATNEVLFQ